MLQVRLFGYLEVVWQGQTVAVRGRAASLLAYLLLHRNVAVGREALADALWPKMGADTARANLRRTLHQLRGALPKLDDGEWLLSAGDKLQWRSDVPLWLDVAEFAQRASNPATLAEAVTLYRGDLLSDMYDDWLFSERERLRYLYIATLERLARTARTARDYAQTIAYPGQLIAREPLHEQATRLLMMARYEGGDRVGALQEYERFTQRLEAEMATAPMAETLALYEAISDDLPLPGFAAPTPADASPEASTTLPLLGREQELTALRSAWRRAAGGRGGLALVSGEAGIDKSRLAEELGHVAEAEGGRWLHGAANAEADAPYHAIVAALRPAVAVLARLVGDVTTLRVLLPLLPELARRRPELTPLPPLEPQRERERLYGAVAHGLTTLAVRPTLIVIEDLHWADSATLDLLQYLAAELTEVPLLLLATYREEEVGRTAALRELRKHANPQLSLRRLDATAGRELAAHALGSGDDAAAAQLYAESEGNPFFLTALAWDWQQHAAMAQVGGVSERTVPQRVAALIGTRVARLPQNTRLLAEVAAVAGASFSIEIVREVVGWDEGQVAEAIGAMLDARIIREAGGDEDYSFNHHLTQESVYRQIDPAVLRRRHYRMARVLEEFYPQRMDEMAVELARHFALGGANAQAVKYYLRAAHYALSLYADAAALTAAVQALELAEEAEQRFAVLELCESSYARQAERDEQRRVLAQMHEIAAELGDAAMMCAVLRRQIDLSAVVGEREAHAALLDESERNHSCACGVELDRDVNAAINILRLGSSQRLQLVAA